MANENMPKRERTKQWLERLTELWLYELPDQPAPGPAAWYRWRDQIARCNPETEHGARLTLERAIKRVGRKHRSALRGGVSMTGDDLRRYLTSVLVHVLTKGK